MVLVSLVLSILAVFFSLNIYLYSKSHPRTTDQHWGIYLTAFYSIFFFPFPISSSKIFFTQEIFHILFNGFHLFIPLSFSLHDCYGFLHSTVQRVLFVSGVAFLFGPVCLYDGPAVAITGGGVSGDLVSDI